MGRKKIAQPVEQQDTSDAEASTLVFDAQDAQDAERSEISQMTNAMSLGNGNYRSMPRFHD